MSEHGWRWLAAALYSIGDAVIATDALGRIRFMNPIAQSLTGWRQDEAAQRDIAEVFRVIHEETRRAADNPVAIVLRRGSAVELTEGIELVSRDGVSIPIADTAAPIRNADGTMSGAVLVFSDITKRRGTEQTLKLSLEIVERAKREWESTVDSLSELVCLVDRQGRVLRANRALEAWNQSDVKTARGRALHELLHVGCAEPACALEALLRQSLAEASQGQPSTRHVDDPVLKRHVLVNLRPVLDRDRRSSRRVVVVLQDVTERVRAEQAEREQRVLAEALRDTASALNSTLHFDEVLDRILTNVGRVVRHDWANILLIDEQTGVARVARWRHLGDDPADDPTPTLGLAVSETPLLRRMAESGLPMVVSDGQAALNGGGIPFVRGARSYVGTPIRVRGQVIGFLSLASATPGFFTPIHGDHLQAFADQAAIAIENARLYDTVNRHADVLEQRVAERTAELNRERKYIETILDTVGESIVVADRDWIITYANSALETISGYAIPEVIGQPVTLLESDRNPPALQEERRRALSHHQAWHGEVINRRKDGTPYDAAATFTPLRNEAGEVVGYVGVQRDVSRLKELDRLKYQFVTRIGHELRTPLTNISIYADLLGRGKPDKHAQYLHTLRLETDRLRHLIEAFLELAALDAGTVPLHVVSADLNQIVSSLAVDWRAQAEASGLAFDETLGPGPLQALVDHSLVARALSNLVSNALNYTPRGGRLSVLTARARSDEQEWATFSVRDTGPGIAPEEMPHVFERFYRGAAARDLTTPGAGLGLVIAKHIAERLGGRIGVESEPGCGATFTVWLKPPAQE